MSAAGTQLGLPYELWYTIYLALSTTKDVARLSETRRALRTVYLENRPAILRSVVHRMLGDSFEPSVAYLRFDNPDWSISEFQVSRMIDLLGVARQWQEACIFHNTDHGSYEVLRIE